MEPQPGVSTELQVGLYTYPEPRLFTDYSSEPLFNSETLGGNESTPENTVSDSSSETESGRWKKGVFVGRTYSLSTSTVAQSSGRKTQHSKKNIMATAIGRMTDAARKKSKNNKYCSVFNCKSKKTEDISLHYFPKEKQIRKEWQTVLLNAKTITDTMRVCSLHFLSSDFFLPGIPTKKRRLKKTAVPSCNLPTRSLGQKTETKELKDLSNHKKMRSSRNHQLLEENDICTTAEPAIQVIPKELQKCEDDPDIVQKKAALMSKAEAWLNLIMKSESAEQLKVLDESMILGIGKWNAVTARMSTTRAILKDAPFYKKVEHQRRLFVKALLKDATFYKNIEHQDDCL